MLDEKKVREIYGEQVWALASAGVDAYAIEIAMSGIEAVLVFSSAGETDIPAFVSFTLQIDDAVSPRALRGEPLREAAMSVCEIGATAVGVTA